MGLAIFCLGYYFVAGLAINVGYHRCLSHRSFRLRKWLERALITLGLPAGTPIQWAGNHRFHHCCADEAGDPHSPMLDGFWRAHSGWYIGSGAAWLCLLYSLAGPLRTLSDGWNRPRTNQERNTLAADVAADAYYRWIGQPLPFFLACALHVVIVFGVAGAAWGARGVVALWVMLTLIYNIGDAIDSFAHLYGDRPFRAVHQARNNKLLGYLALGEGWHANHHVFPRSARHGLLPGQFDWTWQVIRFLERVGLASEVITPEPEMVRRKLSGEHS